MELSPMKSTFSNIYQSEIWNLNAQTGLSQFEKIYKPLLEEYIRMFDINSVVDVGCGHFRWMQELDWSTVSYAGLDVVPGVIRNNLQECTKKNVNFQLADLTTADLPSGDLLIMKDVMQHWPTEDIVQFLPKIRSYKYALITNEVNKYPLKNIPLGGCRPIDLRSAPFNLSAEQVLYYPGIIHQGQRQPKHTLFYRRGANT